MKDLLLMEKSELKQYCKELGSKNMKLKKCLFQLYNWCSDNVRGRGVLEPILKEVKKLLRG